MKEVFEKIIEKMESEYENLKEMYKRTKDMSFYFTFQGVNKAIEIVKKESEKNYHGHFGCNTNGEHERCDGCGLTDCKSRNKIWFGAVDDVTDTKVGNNGWIPVSEHMPNQDGEFSDVLITCESIADGVFVQSAEFYIAADGEPVFDALYHYERVLAWMPLPHPYQTKGE